MRFLYLILFTAVVTPSCRREGKDESKEWYERLHGKYRAINAVSDQAIDANLDGTPTNNLLLELPDLVNNDLEIRILKQDKHLISVGWPEQVVDTGNGTIAVNYVRQGTGRFFSLGQSGNTLEVQQSENEPDLVKWPMPVSVTIDGSGLITVVIHKRIYTSTGWKTVKTTTVYERYTMIT